jgi:hypothetical protein
MWGGNIVAPRRDAVVVAIAYLKEVDPCGSHPSECDLASVADRFISRGVRLL